MSRTVRWKDIVLGEGVPKVCVSVMGASADELKKSVRRAVAAGAQILELRMDRCSEAPSMRDALAACETVRGAAQALPLIFTLRTARDGGAGTMDVQAYEALLTAVAKARVCEAIDVELSVGEDAFVRIARSAHENDVSVVGSSHEFGEIGDARRAGQWLERQQELGADVCKAAAMPQSRVQAFELMLEMARAGELLRVPYIAIVMGEHGVVSRVCAQAMDSCLTFGAAGEASAPGQIDAGTLRAMLAALNA